MATFVVTVAGDNGSDTAPLPGSLRDAILRSDAGNVVFQQNQIDFAIVGPSTIAPSTPLPAITTPVVIDGRTQPNTPVVLDGGLSFETNSTAAGLTVESAGVTIEGLTVDRFLGAGIALEGPGHDQILDDRIGTDPTGETTSGLSGGSSTSTGNGSDGILVDNSPGNTIRGDVLSGNSGDGIHAVGAQAYGNLIAGNFIGTDLAGAKALPNVAIPGFEGKTGSGILLDAAPDNTVGGTAAADANVISGNAGDGVLIDGPGAVLDQVEGNKIGTDAAGKLAIGNAYAGVGIFLGSSDFIGGFVAGSGNVISGNKGDGVLVMGPEDQVIANTVDSNGLDGVELQGSGVGTSMVGQNLIGTDTLGTKGLGNGRDGILVGYGIQAVPLASATLPVLKAGLSVVGNTVDSNGNNGVEIQGPSPAATLQDNFIGTDARGRAGLGNAKGGLLITSSPVPVPVPVPLAAAAPDLVIFTTSGVDVIDNDISGTVVGDGVDVEGIASVRLVGNFVGVDPSGSYALPNVGDGILLDNAPDASVVGNLLSGNRNDGLQVAGTTALVRVPGSTTDTGLDVEGNLVGTDRSGSKAIPNAQGLGISGDGTSNDIAKVVGNVISGNLGSGAHFQDLSGLTLQGNRIGTDRPGTAALANGGNGVELAGTDRVEILFNVIAGNAGFGLVATDSTIVTIQGNHVGVGNDRGTSDGSIPLGNPSGGMALNGVTGSIRDNTVSENGTRDVANTPGIAIGPYFGSLPYTPKPNNLLVVNNRVGTDAGGHLARGNLGDGVEINVTAGVTVMGNILSANAFFGLSAGAATGPQILDNTVGTGASGTESLGNGEGGLALDETTLASVTGNVVVDNHGNGVEIQGGANNQFTNLYLAGNEIGTRSLGPGLGYAAGMGNTGGGVVIAGGSAVTVLGNTIDSNTNGGIAAFPAGSNTSSDIRVQNNDIGTAPDHAANLGNGGDGVTFTSIEGGLISGNSIGSNAGNGVNLQQSSGVMVAGNAIGTDADGQATRLGNRGDGLLIGAPSGSPSTNDYATGNTVVDNLGNGIEVRGVVRSVTLSGNQVGGILNLKRTPGVFYLPGALNPVVSGNDRDGILIDATALAGGGIYVSGSTISNNALDGVHLVDTNGVVLGSYDTIADNDGNGVELDSGSTGNSINAATIQGNNIDGVQVDQSSNNTLNLDVITGNNGKGIRNNQSAGIVVKGGQVFGNKGDRPGG